MLVSNGAQQAIGLAASLFLERGDAVVVESPTYLGAIDIFSAQGARLVPVPTGLGLPAEDIDPGDWYAPEGTFPPAP